MTASPAARENPYVGPRAFRPGERLFGREREALELVDLLTAERIALLYSPSGAGKSSLIQAALVPALRQKRFRVLPIMRVNVDPGQAAAAGRPLRPALSANGPATGRPNRYVLSALLRLEEGQPADQRKPLAKLAGLELGAYLDERREAAGESGAELIIFDQFEEIVSLDPTDVAAKAEFFAQVGAALRDPWRWALFALREEYLASLDPFRRYVPTRLRTGFRLDLLGEQAAAAAIREPARLAGVDFTPAAASKLVDNLRRVRAQGSSAPDERPLGTHVEPVQLQVVCFQLWQKLAPGVTRIVEADVGDTEDLDQALGGYFAERVETIAGESRVPERAIREWIIRHLITARGFRGQVPEGPDESEGLDNRAIRLLVDAHLVRAERRLGATWFELTHDRLIDPVRENHAAWLAARASKLQLKAAHWDQESRPDSALLPNAELAEAERWAAANPDELNAVERAFLAESQTAQARAEAERRTARRFRRLAIGASVAAVLFFATAIVAFFFWHAADIAERTATALSLATAALNTTEQDPELSLLLALQAVSIPQAAGQAVPTDAENALHRALHASHPQLKLSGHAGPVTAAAFRPDGLRLATGGADRTTKVWDTERGHELLTLTGHADRVTAVAFSRDSKQLATAAADGTARLWDAESGQQLHTLSGHVGPVTGIGFDRSGTRIATAGADGTARLWDAASGHELRSLRHGAPVNAVAFTEDGAWLATVGEDKAARLWSLAGDEPPFALFHHSELNGVAFSPDGKLLATASRDRIASLWDLTTRAEVRRLVGHTDWVYGVGFNPLGTRLATAGRDGRAKVWDVKNGAELLSLAGHTQPVYGVAWGPRGRLATAGHDGTARIWETEHHRELLTLLGHTDWIESVAYSPDGAHLASASGDGTVRLWDARSGSPLRTLVPSSPTRAVLSVAFDPRGRRLASAGGDGTLRTWDLDSYQPTPFAPAHADEINQVVFSRDGTRLATASRDRTARVWDSQTGEVLFWSPKHENWVSSVAFSPDGTRLATGSWDKKARIWDFAPGRESAEPLVLPHDSEVNDLAFSPDGSQLATSTMDGKVNLWPVGSGQKPRTLAAHTERVFSLAFNLDGSRLASASWDKTAKVWDTSTGRELLTLYHLADVHDVAFSPTAPALVTGGSGGQVQVYTLDLEELKRLARARLTRGLTDEECQKYLRQERCPSGS